MDEYRQSLMTTAYEYNPPLNSAKIIVNDVPSGEISNPVATNLCSGKTDIPVGWKKRYVEFEGLGVQYPEFTIKGCDKKIELPVQNKYMGINFRIGFTVPLFRMVITSRKKRFRLSFPVPDQKAIGKEISDCIQMGVYLSFFSLPASPGTIASIFVNTFMSCMSKFSDSLDLADFPCKVGVEPKDVPGNTLADLSLC